MRSALRGGEVLLFGAERIEKADFFENKSVRADFTFLGVGQK
jgi:hypothetical protein